MQYLSCKTILLLLFCSLGAVCLAGEDPQSPLGGMVVDRDGKPLSGVRVVGRPFIGRWPSPSPCLEATTGEDGRWSGTAPTGEIRLAFLHPDHVALEQDIWFAGEERFFYLSEEDRTATRQLTKQLANKEYRVAMQDKSGTAIGGLVVDCGGNPIAGATIDFCFHRDQPSTKGVKVVPDVGISPPAPVVSDAHGCWHWDNAPGRLSHLSMCAQLKEDRAGVTECIVVPSLAELADRDDANTEAERKTRRQQLLDLTYRIGAYRPFALLGVVVDEQGNGVAGVQAAAAIRAIVREKDFLTGRESSHQFTIGSNLQQTDNRGRFCFNFSVNPRRLDEYQVMIQPDHGPLYCWVKYPFPEAGESVRLVLPRQRRLEIQVAEASSGNPIADASVVLPPFFVQKDLRRPEEARLHVETPVALKADRNGIIQTLVPVDKALTFTASADGYEKKTVHLARAADLGVESLIISLIRDEKWEHR